MSLQICIRMRIIFLYSDPKGPKMSQKAISEYLKIGRQTVKRWIKKYEKTGDVQDLKRG